MTTSAKTPRASRKGVGGRPTKYDPKFCDMLTVSAAQRLTGAFVYGLADDGGEVFYVGQTRSARRRFDVHKNGRGPNAGLNRKVAELGHRLRVVVLVWEPEDLNAAERAEIRKREGSLVNLVLADDVSWSLNSDLAWSGGQRHHSPTRYIIGQCGREVGRKVSAALAAMPEADRCRAELEALALIPEGLRARFAAWWCVAGPKIAVVLGVDLSGVESLIQRG